MASWWGTVIPDNKPWNTWFYFSEWGCDVMQVKADSKHQAQLADKSIAATGPSAARPIIVVRCYPGDTPNLAVIPANYSMQVESPDGSTAYDMFILSSTQVTFWWGLILPTTPWDKWFYWADWGCDIMMISPSAGHKAQLASKEKGDGTITLRVYEGDTPNIGNLGSTQVEAPCGNDGYTQYDVNGKVPEAITRSQTVGVKAAIKTTQQKTISIKAAIAETKELAPAVVAAIQGAPELEYGIRAAIKGDTEKPVSIRAAIRTERELAPAVVAAVQTEFDLVPQVVAAIQGVPELPVHQRAAIKGTSEITAGIVAYIQVDRTPRIFLEFENLWPQEFGFTGIPNWASTVKDWRKDKLGK